MKQSHYFIDREEYRTGFYRLVFNTYYNRIATKLRIHSNFSANLFWNRNSSCTRFRFCFCDTMCVSFLFFVENKVLLFCYVVVEIGREYSSTKTMKAVLIFRIPLGHRQEKSETVPANLRTDLFST